MNTAVSLFYRGTYKHQIVYKLNIVFSTENRGIFSYVLLNNNRFVPTRSQTIIELLGACAVEFFRSNSPEMQTQIIR